MTHRPIEEKFTRWVCPVCLKSYDALTMCASHIRREHPEPTREALDLVGSYVPYSSYTGQYVIMKVEWVSEGDELLGPCLWGDPCKGAKFKEHFWVYTAECGKPMDRTEAEAEWDRWKVKFMEDREKEFVEAHGCMFGKEGEE